MTTLTVQIDDEVLAEANEALAMTDLTMDQVIERSLRELAERKKSVRDYEAMIRSLQASGVTVPILGREERNARR